jgi:hypothetical protein
MNNPYLIPITKMKMSKDKWLNKKVKYEENLTVKDILEDMSTKTYEWITDKDDLSLVTDYDSFKNDFISLMYDYEKRHNYDMTVITDMTESEEDLYNLKYLEEINSLFLSLKKLDDYYNTNIIRGDFNELFEYIKCNTTIQEFSDDENSDNDLLEI